MSSRQEQKEALRREREERELKQRAAADRRKRLVGIGAAAAVVIAAVAIVAALAGGGDGGGGSQDTGDVLPSGGSAPERQIEELRPAAQAARCELRSVKGSGSQVHTIDPNEIVKYATNPPTTGRHYEIPAEEGAYGEAPRDTALVHTMEHGRVIVWFKPSLPTDERADLKALYDEDTYQTALVPRANMPYAVAATAWNGDPKPNGTGQLLTCDRFDPQVFDAIRAFRDENRGRGPEPIP
jgi:hypothetical protein